eukprot:CAMPEP_0194343676 /NCGR_PEP_ID=MMETSP0171-20130528/98128_1 /TAXON_ID=218684 /ORGANISM="Corethron pennatum, Strain L29A3" /LENGTH=53 /DNA_ID=CAMNT_0039110007 /DNA_START=738 /DNA_END=899 /DNA_ORIENTATION=+
MAQVFLVVRFIKGSYLFLSSRQAELGANEGLGVGTHERKDGAADGAMDGCCVE